MRTVLVGSGDSVRRFLQRRSQRARGAIADQHRIVPANRKAAIRRFSGTYEDRHDVVEGIKRIKEMTASAKEQRELLF